MFTSDWCESEDAEEAGDGGHKCAHLIALDNGNFAAQPNNVQEFACALLSIRMIAVGATVLQIDKLAHAKLRFRTYNIRMVRTEAAAGPRKARCAHQALA
jgi:hypothetical protein